MNRRPGRPRRHPLWMALDQNPWMETASNATQKSLGSRDLRARRGLKERSSPVEFVIVERIKQDADCALIIGCAPVNDVSMGYPFVRTACNVCRGPAACLWLARLGPPRPA